METHRLSGAMAAIGLVFFLVCVGWTAMRNAGSDIPDASLESCKTAIAADKATAVDWTKSHNDLAILAVWPRQTAFNRTLCVIVAGVVQPLPKPVESGGVPAQTAEQPANAGGVVARPAAVTEAAATVAEPVRLHLFLNNLRADHITLKAKPIATPQTLLISLQQQQDFSQTAARFWRDLLHSGTDLSRKVISIGMSRTETDTAEVVRDNATTLVLFDVQVAILAALAFVLLVGSFVLCVRRSSLLRDDPYVWIESELQALRDDAVTAGNQPVPDEKPEDRRARQAALRKLVEGLDGELARFKAGTNDKPVRLRCTYSLARSQMAFWLILSTSGFAYIWLTTGQYYNLITGGLLVLLGISGTTGIAAIQMTQDAAAKRRSRNFVSDILSDGDGPQLYRLQAVAWTLILGLIFIWHVLYDFRFSEFDQNLLIMIGISQSLYLGFKARDTMAKT